MDEKSKKAWYRSWFAGVGRKEYLFSLPFCVGMLLLPLLPTWGVYYVLRQGRAPLIILLLLALALVFPVLRIKRPRIAWWVGTVAAAASVFGLLLLNVVVGVFFGFYTFLTWIIAIAFLIFNWNRMRWWSYAVVAALILIHMIPLGFSRTLMTLLVMGLMALYFRLPDRDNFPRAPIVVSIVMAMLISHGTSFYFDVGGRTELRDHPAARMVFEYQSQRRGWARTLGRNTRFLTPSCKGDRFYVGSKFTFKSGLTIIDPATGKSQKIPMRGGTTDNMAMTCNPERLYVGNMGANQILLLDPERPRQPLAAERMPGVRVGLIRLERRTNLLLVASSNTRMLHALKAGTLADKGGAELGASVTDFVIDHAKREVVAVTMGGEVVRVHLRNGVTKRKKLRPGMLIYNLELDHQNRRLFVDSMFGRQLVVLDADTLEELQRRPVRKGSRYMQFDHKRGLLYLGNFYTGTVMALDSLTLEKVWSLQVGKRVRYLTLDGIRDQLCFTSQAGGYCLELEKLSPAPPPEPSPIPEPETPATGEDVETGQETPAPAEPESGAGDAGE